MDIIAMLSELSQRIEKLRSEVLILRCNLVGREELSQEDSDFVLSEQDEYSELFDNAFQIFFQVRSFMETAFASNGSLITADQIDSITWHGAVIANCLKLKTYLRLLAKSHQAVNKSELEKLLLFDFEIIES